MTIYIIGHSTRTKDDFIALLAAHRIEALVDIRAFPASQRLAPLQARKSGKELVETLEDRVNFLRGNQPIRHYIEERTPPFLRSSH